MQRLQAEAEKDSIEALAEQARLFNKEFKNDSGEPLLPTSGTGGQVPTKTKGGSTKVTPPRYSPNSDT